MGTQTGAEARFRPVLMSGGMVRRILAGRKTQTRRIFDDGSRRRKDGARLLPELLVQLARDEGGYGSLCPYGGPGDRLWVRETWASVPSAQTRMHDRGPGIWPGVDGRPSTPDVDSDLRSVIYRADGEFVSSSGERHDWRPSIFMPRWASRLTLDVVAVRLERLHEISPEDCLAEGLEDPDGRYGWHPETAVNWYRKLWEKLHGTGSWETNPWVWVVEFRPLESTKER